jgi:hypothetical protein
MTGYRAQTQATTNPTLPHPDERSRCPTTSSQQTKQQQEFILNQKQAPTKSADNKRK